MRICSSALGLATYSAHLMRRVIKTNRFNYICKSYSRGSIADGQTRLGSVVIVVVVLIPAGCWRTHASHHMHCMRQVYLLSEIHHFTIWSISSGDGGVCWWFTLIWYGPWNSPAVITMSGASSLGQRTPHNYPLPAAHYIYAHNACQFI